MINELKWLLQLQELDQELARLKDDVRRFEPALEGVKRERMRRAAESQKRERETAAAASERRKLEGELKDAETRLERFRQQQQQVRTAKEAEAMEHEVSASAAHVSTLEEQILSLLEKEEKLTSQHIHKNQQEHAAENLAGREQQRLLTLRDEKEQLAKTLQGDRIAAANKLSDDLRDTYEWLLKRHGPTAVADVTGGACGGCGNVLVAQMGFRAKAGDELVQCPNCQRFLK